MIRLRWRRRKTENERNRPRMSKFIRAYRLGVGGWVGWLIDAFSLSMYVYLSIYLSVIASSVRDLENVFEDEGE